MNDDAPNFCPYCLAEHDRPRPKYCSHEHAHRAKLERQRGREKVLRFYPKVQTRAIAEGYRQSHWRAIRNGYVPDPHLIALLGTVPNPTTHVAEWDE